MGVGSAPRSAESAGREPKRAEEADNTQQTSAVEDLSAGSSTPVGQPRSDAPSLLPPALGVILRPVANRLAGIVDVVISRRRLAECFADSVRAVRTDGHILS